jgi:plasmid stabilization system protein ParE
VGTAKRKRSDSLERVFLNLAYVRENEDFFVGLISGVSALGLVPTCALDQDAVLQFDRALGTISACRYSIHDLSVLGADGKSPRTAHMNMPFELGIAVAAGARATPRHDWFVFGDDVDRIERALSDIKAVTVHTHERTGETAVEAVSRALYRAKRDDVELPTMLDVYRSVRAAWQKARRRERLASAFLSPAFSAISRQAVQATQIHVFGLQT